MAAVNILHTFNSSAADEPTADGRSAPPPYRPMALLAALTSVVGARCRLSTYQILVFSFGTRGAQLVNIVLAVMLLGWFAVSADMLGGTVQNAVATLYHDIERFVRVTVPLLTALMVYVLALSISRSA